MSFNFRVDSITNKTDSGNVNLSFGSSLPDGSKIVPSGNVVVSGVSTVGVLSVSNSNIGIITAIRFIGDGSGLQNISTITLSNAYAIKLIISDPPLRS